MRQLIAPFLVAACALPLRAAGQSDLEKPAQACPRPAEVNQQHLLGLWRAEFEGLGQSATLLLERHPEFTQSLAGTINRNGDRRAVVGDIEDGGFTLEESADGVHIAATWIGEVVEDSCGKEIRGTWTVEGETAGRAFVLRKQ